MHRTGLASSMSLSPAGDDEHPPGVTGRADWFAGAVIIGRGVSRYGVVSSEFGSGY
jgi:hypothetical protein